MLKFNQYVEDVENFELDEEELSEITKTLSMAARALQKVWDRKKSQAKHSLAYYAAQVARGYQGVNPRDLVDLVTEENLPEASKGLSFATRAKMKRNAIKNRNKMKLGARRQKKKIASLSRLKKRARRSARRAFTKKVGGGKAPTSVGQKNVIMKRLGSKGFQGKIARVTKRTVRVARKRDMQRKQGGAGKTRTG